MYAVIRSGGKQYRAEPGKIIDVERLAVEEGQSITIKDVLLVVTDDGTVHIGRPLLEGTSVAATVVNHYRAKKVLIWKYRPGLRYRRRRGHRHYYTRLRIESIS